VVGVGINVNEPVKQNPTLANEAISVSEALGRTVEREPLLAGIMNHLEPLLLLPMGAILQRYRTYDMLLGRTLIVKPKVHSCTYSLSNMSRAGTTLLAHILLSLLATMRPACSRCGTRMAGRRTCTAPTSPSGPAERPHDTASSDTV
jgi:hypothetical protein